MALALTFLSIFTLVGLVLSSWSGWALTHALGSPTLQRHIAVAVPSVLFSLFTQSMVLFFFIGTGKLLKEAAAKRDEAARAYILGKVRDIKMRTSALATFTPLSALAAGLLGAGSHTGRTPAWLHLGCAGLALVLHLWAFGREVVAMAETNQLLDEAATLTPPQG